VARALAVVGAVTAILVGGAFRGVCTLRARASRLCCRSSTNSPVVWRLRPGGRTHRETECFGHVRSGCCLPQG
jgi:hypothetical protein